MKSDNGTSDVYYILSLINDNDIDLMSKEKLSL